MQTAESLKTIDIKSKIIIIEVLVNQETVINPVVFHKN